MPRPPASERPEIDVLRVGHRAGRDPRLSTHLALTARAFGAGTMWLHPPDPSIARSLEAVRTRWGGTFSVEGCEDWRSLVRQFEGPSVHLTMYGEPLEEVAGALSREKRLLVVVGGAKVPSELFGLARWNVGVGAQPHSEVAALAVLLHALRGPPEAGGWPGAKQVVLPSARGKRVRMVR